MVDRMPQAVVIGAGIGGLCTAIALRQAGVSVTVYERAEKAEPVGAGLSLWPNALKALRKLGVAEAVLGAGARLEHSELRTMGGDRLSVTDVGELEKRYGAPGVAIHRATLHAILLDALPPATVCWGKACAGFTEEGERVTVHLADGARDTADLVVAADGIHSTIRNQILPNLRLRYSGYTAWRGVVEAHDPVALGELSESWGLGRRFGIVPIDAVHIYWFATHNQPEGQSLLPVERKELLLRLFRNWHAPVERLIEDTPAEGILQNDIIDVRPFRPWHVGRVVLLGDAAHPTTPNMGQGACMAMESSVVLARALAEESSIEAALRRYEGERMPRTAWITNQSWMLGRVAQLGNPLVCGLRDGILRRVPRSVMLAPLDRAAGYEV